MPDELSIISLEVNTKLVFAEASVQEPRIQDGGENFETIKVIEHPRNDIAAIMMIADIIRLERAFHVLFDRARMVWDTYILQHSNVFFVTVIRIAC